METQKMSLRTWCCGVGVLLLCLTMSHAAGAAARPKFLACHETNWKGESTFLVMEQEEFDARKEEMEEANRFLRQAYTAARRAWREDEDVRGEKFPVKSPKPLRIIRLASYSEREKAEAVAARRTEKVDRQLETEKRSDERRQTRLRGSALERYEREKELVEKAEELLEAKFKELTSGGEAEKSKGPRRKADKEPEKDEKEKED